MKVTGAISLYVHACTSLCRLAAVSAVAALLCMSVMSCSDDGKRGDERTPEHEAALKSLDDSIFVKSEYVMRTMREGMAVYISIWATSRRLCAAIRCPTATSD